MFKTLHKDTKSNARIGDISEDFTLRILLESDEKQKDLDVEAEERCDRVMELKEGTEERNSIQTEINTFYEYWHTRISNATGEEYDKSQAYVNPNAKEHIAGYGKDLYLAKRRISPVGFENLRTVMVGDHVDEDSIHSDPTVPLVVVSDSVRHGDWNLVSVAVDYLMPIFIKSINLRLNTIPFFSTLF